MPAPISVILDFTAPTNAVGPTLGALAHGAVAGLVRDMIVVGGPAAADLADHAGASHHDGDAASAAGVCAGDWLMFWKPEATPPEDWTELVRAHIEAHPGDAACFDLAPQRRGGAAARLMSHCAVVSARLFGRRFPEQGLLAPRGLYLSGAPLRARRLPGNVEVAA